MTELEQRRGKILYDVFNRRYYEANPFTRRQHAHRPVTWDELPLWRKYVFMGTAEEVGPMM